ncbi:MAG: hypothetical protein VKJ44_07840 [Synechococcus sp.]|nr:hypothetical protein [Synechococcus sp.]
MLSTVVLRLVPIVLLAIGLVHPLPLAVALPLLALLGWWLLRPQERRLHKAGQHGREIGLQREPLEAQLQALATLHDQRILALQQELETGRAREQALAGEVLQWQQSAEASRHAERNLEAQEQRLQQEMQISQALLDEAQATIDQLRFELAAAQDRVNQLQLERSQNQAAAESAPAAVPIQVLPAQNAAGNGALILASSERDLYPQERRELLLTLLRLAVADQGTGCRGFTASPRALHILDDLIAHNPLQRQRPSQQFSNSIKQAFRAESTVRLQQNLRPLGFECTQAANGHVIVTVRGDDRYQLQVSSTPSDHHSRQNEAQRLVKMLLSRTAA